MKMIPGCLLWRTPGGLVPPAPGRVDERVVFGLDMSVAKDVIALFQMTEFIVGYPVNPRVAQALVDP